MDFGKVPEDELPKVDFTLPADPILTNETLKAAKQSGGLEVYIGCAKWGRKEWVGMIYPPKTREAFFLDEYVKHFNSIELNAVFYTMPKADQIISWKKKAESIRSDFKFFPKITRSISHLKRLKNAEEETNVYLQRISAFGKTLGPCFLQLSDNFGPKNLPVLAGYLEQLPKDFQLSVEVRHPDWFSDKVARHELFSTLRGLGKGSVITDASGRRDCVHMELPTPDAFIRFVGNGLHSSDYLRIDEWAERLRQWKEQGLSSVYFFLHQHDEKDTPVLADYAIEKMNNALGCNLPRVHFLDKS